MDNTNPTLEQERKVIILATTRGNEESHPRNGLGFLMNPQRTNGLFLPPTDTLNTYR